MKPRTRTLTLVVAAALLIAIPMGALITIRVINGNTQKCLTISRDSDTWKQLQRQVTIKAPTVTLENLYFDIIKVDDMEFTIYAGKLSAGPVAVWREWFDWINVREYIASVNDTAVQYSTYWYDTSRSYKMATNSATKDLIACANRPA